MKRFIAAAAVLILCAAAASAQPRAIGGRIGSTGLDFSYEHSLGDNFIEANAGLDFGAAGLPGFKATALYNFVFARPAWTDRGTWGLYAGPGLSMGYVADRFYWIRENDLPGGGVDYRKYHNTDYGFMFSFTGQIGLEYTFWFPLQLSVDIRPYIGFHVNDRNGTSRSQVEFYEYGLFGFIPTLAARFRF